MIKMMYSRNHDFRTLLNNIQSRKETYKEWGILTLLLLHMFTLLEGTTNSFFVFSKYPVKENNWAHLIAAIKHKIVKKYNLE